MTTDSPIADLQSTLRLLAMSDKLDRERLLGRWADKHLVELQAALESNAKAMDFLHPHLDAGTFAAPDWAIHLASILTGGEPLSTPAASGSDTPAATERAGPAKKLRCGDVHHELDAYLWLRESTNEWVLELSGSINGTSFVTRHPQPASLAPEDAVGLPALYDRSESADRWDALMGGGHIRVLGSAGLHTAKTPYGEDWDGYAHIGLELWTKYDVAEHRPTDAPAQLTRYVDVLRGLPTPAQLASTLHPSSSTGTAPEGQVNP